MALLACCALLVTIVSRHLLDLSPALTDYTLMRLGWLCVRAVLLASHVWLRRLRLLTVRLAITVSLETYSAMYVLAAALFVLSHVPCCHYNYVLV